MRLPRRAPRPRATTFRPAERYLTAAAEVARGLGAGAIGTKHLLLGLVRSPQGGAARTLERLGVAPEVLADALATRLEARTPVIDADALATLSIDLDAVRVRLEQTFGPGALERTHAGCLGIAPDAKLALAFAVDRAEGRPVADHHILLGLLSVPDCDAARALAGLGATLPAVEAVSRPRGGRR